MIGSSAPANAKLLHRVIPYIDTVMTYNKNEVSPIPRTDRLFLQIHRIWIVAYGRMPALPAVRHLMLANESDDCRCCLALLISPGDGSRTIAFLQTIIAEPGVVASRNFHGLLGSYRKILFILGQMRPVKNTILAAIDGQYGQFRPRNVLRTIGCQKYDPLELVRMLGRVLSGHGSTHGMAGDPLAGDGPMPCYDRVGGPSFENRQIDRHLDNHAVIPLLS